MAALDKNGYGRLGHDYKRILAHRVAWTLATGQRPPDDIDILHTCDIPACVRNDDAGIYVVGGKEFERHGHLWAGTHDDNMIDMTEKGRRIPPAAKITAAQATEMRQRYTADNISPLMLSIDYGISRSSVYSILNRKTWADVE